MYKYIKRLYKYLSRTRWEIGLIRDGLNGIFKDAPLIVDWVVNPYRDRWFADPFILDVTDDYIFILAEEYQFKTKKGRIAKLDINRQTNVIEKMSIILEGETHFSFPTILRKDNRVYVSPENCQNGRLDLYEFDEISNKLVFVQTICDDTVWDSTIVHFAGKPQLFAAKTNDYYLDIYDWDECKTRFIFSYSVKSQLKDSRMAGQEFSFDGTPYIPTQDCTSHYGEAVLLKKVILDKNGDYTFETIKRLTSPHKTYKQSLHTLNEYKGVAVIDVRGFDHPIIGPFIFRFSQWLNLIKKRLTNNF